MPEPAPPRAAVASGVSPLTASALLLPASMVVAVTALMPLAIQAIERYGRTKAF